MYKSKSKFEVLVILLILTLSFHPITKLLISWFSNPVELYKAIGAKNYSNIWEAASIIMPLILCLTSLKRSGITIGSWRKHYLNTIAICSIPIILTLIIYPFTSQPFRNIHIGVWLISPLAQDLFGGYLYGVLDEKFKGKLSIGRIQLNYAIPLVAIYASLWHLPNFQSIGLMYTIFQLLYIFVFASLIYLTRQWTGSMIPIWLTHVCVNLISWW